MYIGFHTVTFALIFRGFSLFGWEVLILFELYNPNNIIATKKM